jgi:hypothetical protein
MTCKTCFQGLSSKFCPDCGEAQDPTDKATNNNPFGLWKVSTEADCEGRSMKHLGYYEGYVDVIAKGLSSLACYNLYFSRVQLRTEANAKFPPPVIHGEVRIYLEGNETVIGMFTKRLGVEVKTPGKNEAHLTFLKS